jgi:2,4-dienoyl-CoA reductase-like NADH-dependent reductase (Old Yellow Enzyme family)
VRISATDWVKGGFDIEQSVVLAEELAKYEVDLIDCSSGGVVPYVKIKEKPGYQVPFAKKIRDKANIKTAAVGMITKPLQANRIIEQRKADLVLLGREMLRNPYWPLHAASILDKKIKWPIQYIRARI